MKERLAISERVELGRKTAAVTEATYLHTVWLFDYETCVEAMVCSAA